MSVCWQNNCHLTIIQLSIWIVYLTRTQAIVFLALFTVYTSVLDVQSPHTVHKTNYFICSTENFCFKNRSNRFFWSVENLVWAALLLVWTMKAKMRQHKRKNRRNQLTQSVSYVELHRWANLKIVITRPPSQQQQMSFVLKQHENIFRKRVPNKKLNLKNSPRSHLFETSTFLTWMLYMLFIANGWMIYSLCPRRNMFDVFFVLHSAIIWCGTAKIHISISFKQTKYKRHTRTHAYESWEPRNWQHNRFYICRRCNI